MEALETRRLLTAISWTGGSGNFSNTMDWSSHTVPGTGDTVSITTSGITITLDQAVTIQSIQSSANLTLSNPLTVTAGTSSVSGSLMIASGSNLTASGAGTSFTASGATTADGASLFANSGAVLSLPKLTSYAMGNSDYFQATGSGSAINLAGLTSVSAPGNFLYIYARSGGRVDLPDLGTIANAYVNISADGADASNVPSTVNLPALTSFSDTAVQYGDLSATNGGDIIDPLVTTAKGVNITLDAANPAVASQMNTSQLTNIDGSSLYANSGATLSLPNLASFAMANGNFFQATGTGSVITLAALTSISAPSNFLYIYGRSGGRVNLPVLATITNSYVNISADGTNASNVPSTVNLPALTSFSDTAVQYGDLSATNGGDIIDPLVTTAKGVNITLDAANPAVASQMNVSQLTNIDGSNLYANSGATLSLPNLASFAMANGNFFQATGTGSVITLAVLTSISAPSNFLYIYGRSGGRVNLPVLATITNSYVNISADGTNASNVPSTVNLPALTSFSDTAVQYGDLSATNGGDIIDPLVTTAKGVNITLDAANPAVASQMNVSQLTNIDGSNLYANSGATLSLPNLASFAMANGNFFQATGTGSVITLAALTSISAPSNFLYIYGRSGGRVNLPVLATITNSYVNISADGANASNVPSTVNLPALTSFSDTAVQYGDLSATSGGDVIDSLLATAKGVSITLDAANPAVASQMNTSQLTNIDGSSLYANSGATLSLPKVASFAMANGNYFEATGSGSAINLAGLTSISAPSSFLYIYARSGGRVNLASLATIGNEYVNISADGADVSNVPSTVNLPALTDFSDSNGTSGYLSATSGGHVIAGTSIAVAGVAVTFDAASTLTTNNLTLNGGSTLSGTGTFAGSVNNQAGLLYPGGNSIRGSLAIGGSFTQGQTAQPTLTSAAPLPEPDTTRLP